MKSKNNRLRLIASCTSISIAYLSRLRAIDIEVQDAINRNRLFFDFMLRMFGHLNQLYEMGKILLIDTILKYHLRKESAKENSSKPSP